MWGNGELVIRRVEISTPARDRNATGNVKQPAAKFFTSRSIARTVYGRGELRTNGDFISRKQKLQFV
jgi:hypothetical protein